MARKRSTKATDTASSGRRTTHYEARGTWDLGGLAEFFETPIANAIIREGEISIEWPPLEGIAPQTVLQKSSGSRYFGRSIWARGTSHEDVAEVEAVLYSNELGHILVGQETWRSGTTDWFVVQLIA
jgi:hypothetical protein